MLIALVIASTPVLYTFLDTLNPQRTSNLPTIAFGVCTVLAILMRWRCKIPFSKESGWLDQLSLTHTAVALGCIPAVALLLFSPELLAERHDVLTESIQPGAQTQSARPSLFIMGCMIVGIAGWVSITEEIIFRSLLVSVIRRWSFIASQRRRDVLAGIVSALLFGLAHYATWGPIASIALVGLGLGFVLAYIANDEHVLPLIFYHFIFDVLSIGVSVLM